MTQRSHQPYQHRFPFLQGGGEMGERISLFDWSDSSLGEPSTWPANLKTTLGMMLKAKFPMFLLWGTDEICFYNDAFEPILHALGNQSAVLGKPASLAWPQIQPFTKHILDDNNELSDSRQQELISLHFHDGVKDIYQSFSFSRVIDDSGLTDGILVTSSEMVSHLHLNGQPQNHREQLHNAKLAETEARKKSQENEENLKIIIHQAPVAMAIFRGKNYVVEIANAKALELWSKSWEEVENKPILQAMPELEHQGIREILNNVYQTGKPFSATELPVQLFRNGLLQTTYINFVYEALYDADKTINGLIAIGTDVTAQVQNRRRIEESEERFRTMAEGTDILISVSDETGKQSYFNNAWMNLTGRSQDELIHNNWFDLIHPDDKDRYLETQALALRKKASFSAEFRLLNKAGQYRWLLMQSPTRRHSDDSFAGYISSCIDVTESRQHERELQISEQNLDQIVNQLPIPVVLLRGSNFVIDKANSAILNLWKKRKSEMIGQPILQQLPELEGQPFLEQLHHVLITGQTITNRETPVFHTQQDGSFKTFYVDYYYQRILNADNEHSVLATVIDVTDKIESRKLLEDSQYELQAINEELATINEELVSTNEELNKSQDKLRKLNETLSESRYQLQFAINATELGTWRLDPATRLFTSNERLKLWFGLPVDEKPVDLKMAIDVMDISDRERVRSAILEAMDYRTGGKYDVEFNIVNPKTNVPRYVRAKGRTIFDSYNRPIVLSGTLQDITEEKIVSAKLAETNERLQLALDAGRLGSYDLDLMSGKITCTEQCKANFGFSSTDKFDFPELINCILPEYREYVQERIKTAADNNEFYTAEYPIAWPDKSIHWISASGKTLYDNEGKPVRLTGITLDITERKLDDLRKNDFIGMVSHELKTPLTSLTAFIQIVNARVKTSGDIFGTNLLDKAFVQVRKMSTLINGFLNVSRFESGKISIVKQKFDLNELLAEMVSESELTVSSHKFAFSPCDSIEVNADRDKIGSVISNLLSNAVKYSPQGKTITVQCRQIDKVAQISVQDCGMGISEKDQEKLFDRYYRVESNTTQHIAGFGIGLYLCAEILHRHDGSIWVESKPGEGSTFHFSLPLA